MSQVAETVVITKTGKVYVRRTRPQLPRDVARAERSVTEDNVIDERELSAEEKSKREEIVKAMKADKDELQNRYGDRWKEIMYATATKKAKEVMEGKMIPSFSDAAAAFGAKHYNKKHGTNFEPGAVKAYIHGGDHPQVDDLVAHVAHHHNVESDPRHLQNTFGFDNEQVRRMHGQVNEEFVIEAFKSGVVRIKDQNGFVVESCDAKEAASVVKARSKKGKSLQEFDADSTVTAERLKYLKRRRDYEYVHNSLTEKKEPTSKIKFGRKKKTKIIVNPRHHEI